MSLGSQSRRRHRLSRAVKVRRLVSRLRDEVESDYFVNLDDSRCPVRDADGVWRQPRDLMYSSEDDDD